MKKKLYWGALALEAVLCLVLAFNPSSANLAALAALPFAPLGDLLRQLSLSGSFGNLLAWLLYAFICLLPLLLLLLHRKRCPEDWMIAVLCAVLFAVLYCMINPSLLGEVFTATESAGKAVLGGSFWSLLIAYELLRLRRRLASADSSVLLSCLTALMLVINVLLVAVLFYGCTAALLAELQTLRAGNTALSPQQLAPSTFFVILRGLAQAVPYGLDIAVVFAALRLLAQLKADRYSQQTLKAADALAALSGRTLVCTALIHGGLQLLQLVFIRQLCSVSAAVEVPLTSVALMAAALLVSRYIQETQKLKAENDSFI